MKDYEQILDEFDQYKDLLKDNNWKGQALYLLCLGEAMANEASICTNAINCENSFYQKSYYYAQAFTFLNSALLRAGEKYDYDQELVSYINNKISNIYNRFLYSINVVHQPENDFEYHKLKLAGLRYSIDTTKKIIELNQEINFNQEEKQTAKINNVKQLYNFMETEMSAFLGGLIYESIQMLGESPCGFSVFGLGSFARGEMTPFSDFEWGILIDEPRSGYLIDIDRKIKLIIDKYYFRKLAALVQMRIINLGETSLRVVGVEKFKDLYSSGDFDLVSGFCFDAQYKGACRTPLGNKHCEGEDQSFELICTVEELLNFQNDNWQKADKMLLLELANIKPINAIHNKQDRSLFNQYKAKLSASTRIRQKIALELLKSDAKKFQHGLGLPIEEGKFYEIKRDFYRLPDRMIENLSIIFDIDEQDPYKRLNELENQNIITKDRANNLATVLAIANYIRLSGYLAANAREEIMSTAYSNSNANMQLLSFDKKTNKFFLQNQNPIFRYYSTIIPLYKLLKDFISKIIEQNNLDIKILKENIQQIMIPLFENTPKVRAMIYARFMYYQKAIDELDRIHDEEIDYGVCMLKGNCFYSQKKVERALLEFKKALDFAKTLNNKSLLAGAYSNYGNMLSIKWNSLASYYLKKALDIKKELYENHKPIEYAAELVNFWANILDRLLRKKTTIYNWPQIVDELKNAKKIYDNQKFNDYKIIEPYNNLAIALIYSNMQQEAKKLLEISLETTLKYYEKSHIKQALILENIGNLYLELKDYDKASSYSREAGELFKNVHNQKERGDDLIDKANKLQKVIQSSSCIIYNFRIVYDNPILNNPHFQNILQFAYKKGGIESVNQMINLGLNNKINIGFLDKIKTFSIEKAISQELDNLKSANNYLCFSSSRYLENNFASKKCHQNKLFAIKDMDNAYQTNHVFDGFSNSDLLVINAFLLKESIDAAPLIKYFFKEVLQLPYFIPSVILKLEIPEFIKSNYFWVSTYYASYTIGTLAITKFEISYKAIIIPIVATITYGIKLYAYDYFVNQKQEHSENDSIKHIQTSQDFIEKCSLDIFNHALLGFINGGLTKMILPMPLLSILYDIAISATIGGLNCYNFYQQEKTKQILPEFEEGHQVNIKTIIPYIVDSAVFYTTMKNMDFDSNSLISVMMNIKQVLVIINNVVIADYTTKLVLSSVQDTYINYIINNINQEIKETLKDTYTYLTGEMENKHIDLVEAVF